MMVNRQRVRSRYSPQELSRIYAQPHDSSHHIDHKLRLAVTINMARSIKDRFESVADLSCGDGTVLRCLQADRITRGDFAPGYEVTGPIEATIQTIEPVELYVCTETLEHLDDPDHVLRLIRSKTNWMVLSTPIDAWGDHNPEHYWAWGRRGVEHMLSSAGFGIQLYCALDFRPAGSQYCFGIWVVN